MLRIRANCLGTENDKLIYDGELFSGLSCEVDDGGLLTGFQVIADGVATGASDDYLELPDGGLRVDEDELEQFEDYGPYAYQGEAFTGVGYSFEPDGQCTGETVYRNGHASRARMRTWYTTGEPNVLIADGSYMAWFADGRLKMQSTSEGTVYNVAVDDDGHLAGVVIRRKELADMDTICSFPVAGQLFLGGSGIDNDLILQISQRMDLSPLWKLTVRKTSVDSGLIKFAQSLENLSSVTFIENAGLSRADAVELKNANPRLVINFDDELIQVEPDGPPRQGMAQE